jgi:hypothetical protein
MGNKKQIRYDITLLKEITKRDNIVLLENYNKLNRETKIKFVCPCGNEESNKTFRMIYNKSGFNCKKCSYESGKKKQKEVIIEKYGVDNVFKNKEIKEKIKETNLKKYGVEYSIQNDKVKEKIKETNLQKYGVEFPFQNDKVKEKIKETNLQKYGVISPLQNSDIMKKVKETNLQKYGFEYSIQNDKVKEKIKETNNKKYKSDYGFQNKEIKEKIKETILQKYGVDTILKSELIKDKIKETNLQKYGVYNPLQNKEIKKRRDETNLQKYGVIYPLQNKELQVKVQNNSKKYKEYIMPSGIIRKIQGYEHFALNELLKFYKEDDIITERKEITRFKYSIEGKNKYYFPDIFIKSINKIIEVKSTWTYKAKDDNIKFKACCVKDDGYDYEIWIYNSKGIKEIKYE